MRKRNLLLAGVAVLAYVVFQGQGRFLPIPFSWTQVSDTALQHAYTNKQSDLQVQGEGVVVKVLPDDLHGSRHQKFIVRVSPEQTLMIAHNIDLAPRIEGLRKGDRVGFYGEYEWTTQGGVLHWTHLDPSGRHISGWLQHGGKTYR